MAVIKVFGQLRRLAGAAMFQLEGETVREILDRLCAGKPDLRAAIFDEQGMKPYVRVIVGGRDVELSQKLDTPIGPQDQVSIFPPIAGGDLYASEILPGL